MDIMTELNGVFREMFEDESLSISRTTTANDVDGWDSITHMILITAVEKKFGINFSMADLARMNMVGDMADIIEKKISEKQ